MFFRFCSECSHSWPITKGHFYKNFQGFTYCSVFKVLCCFATARLLYHSVFCLSTTFFNFFEFVFSMKLSGERGIWTLAPVSRPTPLAGAPLRPLEYFSPTAVCYDFFFAFCRFRQTQVLLYKTPFILSTTFLFIFSTFFHLLYILYFSYIPTIYSLWP